LLQFADCDVIDRSASSPLSCSFEEIWSLE
jgi:hypothetical protein